MFILLLLFSLQNATQAQQNSSSTSEINETVDLYVHPDSKKQSPLIRMEKANQDLIQEKAELEKLKKTQSDDCLTEEIKLREEDANFYETHKDQINSLIATIKKGLRVQTELLHGFEQGRATNNPEDFEKYTNSKGMPDQSEYIEVKLSESPTDTAVKKIYVKDLIRYITKFETEAKTVSDDPKAVDAFVEQYRQAKTATDPNYFNMTLDQALKAYSGCVTGCLESVFQISYHQQQKRSLTIGAGKHLFRLTTTTVLGVDPNYPGTKLGTLLNPKVNDGDLNTSVNLVQDFGEAMAVAAEDSYWKVIRDQQLTINGIPIDGYLRRVYFDNKRGVDCSSYTFNENSTPGPFLSYDQKTECTKVGIQVQNVIIKKVGQGAQWCGGGGTAPMGSIFEITEAVKKVADGQMNHTDDYNAIVQSLGIAHHDAIDLVINYTCGCNKHQLTFTAPNYKLSSSVTFGNCPHR